MGFIIVLATPVFLLAIAFECWWAWRLSRQGQEASQTYRWDDAVNSISLGVISQLSAVFTRLLRITIYLQPHIYVLARLIRGWCGN